MLKTKKLLLLTLSLFSLSFCSILTSCNNTPPSSTPPSNTGDPFDPIVVDEITEGTYGGWLEDVVVLNRFLGHNSQYGFTYTAPNSDLSLRMQSSNESVFTIEKSDAAANSYVIVTHQPGNAVLTIYDSTDYLYFRKIVRVRTAYTPETIQTPAFDNDIYAGFTGFGGSYRLTCIKTEPSFQWQLTGKDEVEINGMDIVFDCTYSNFYEPWDMYVFETTIVSEHQNNQTDIVYLYISRTADVINLYYGIGGGDNALLNIFSPLIYSEIRPGF